MRFRKVEVNVEVYLQLLLVYVAVKVLLHVAFLRFTHYLVNLVLTLFQNFTYPILAGYLAKRYRIVMCFQYQRIVLF